MRAPWFPDPVMLKEIRAGARNWTLYVGRMVYVSLIALILYAFWRSLEQFRSRDSLSEYATIGRQLFSIFAGFQVLFATLQGISGASDLISRETRSGTLGLLGLTPLSPFRIAFGKFQAAMAQPLQVILAGTPVLAICIYLGGVPPSSLAWCTSLSLACGALGASTALLCSACFKTGAGAAITSVILLALYSLAPGLLLAVFFSGSSNAMSFMAIIASLHPVWALAMAMGGGFGGGWSSDAWIIAVPVSFAQALLLVWFTGRRLGVLLHSRSFAASLESMLFPGLPPSVARVPDRTVWERWPLLWKELQTPSGNRLGRRFRIALALFFCVLMPLSLIFSSGHRYWVGLLLWFGGILLLFLSVGTGAGLFVREKEERKWDILLTTPLSAGQILGAKLLGGLADLLPLAGLLLLVSTGTALLRGAELWAWMLIVLAVALPVILSYVLSALISLRATTSRRAFSTAFGGMLILYFLLPSVLGLLIVILSRSTGNSELLISIISPAGYLANFSDWTGRFNGTSLGTLLLPQAGHFLGFVALHGLLILGCLELMRASFKRAAGRA